MEHDTESISENIAKPDGSLIDTPTSVPPESGAEGQEPESFLVPVTVRSAPKPAFSGPSAAAVGSTDTPNATTPMSLEAPQIDSAKSVQRTSMTDVRRPMDMSSVDQGSLLDQISMDEPLEDVAPSPRGRWSRRRMVGLGLLMFGCLAAIALGIRIEINKSKSQDALLSASQHFRQQTTSLPAIGSQLGTKSQVPQGALTVNGSLILAPSVQPSSPLPGQLYFNQAANQMLYYDGTGYVHLQGGNVVTNNTYKNSTVNNTYSSSTVNNSYISYPTSTSVNNITNVTNVTNVSGGGIGGTGTPGTLAMFANGTTLGDSLVNQSGSTVNVASAGTNTVNVGSGAGTSTTGIQGGTGGASLLTGAATGASGNITIMSGASSTTASGNVTIDSGSNFVSGTIVDDRDFESGTQAFGSWFGNTVTTSNAQAHGGVQSLAETGTGGAWGIIENANVSYAPITPGHHYFFSAWARAGTTSRTITPTIVWINSGGTIQTSLVLNTVTDASSGWTQVTGIGVAPAGMVGAYWKFSSTGTAGEVHYFDDLVTTDLSSGSAASELNLGATNAQVITIGNMNEFGPTTIDGGSGITMNAGSANFALSAGAISISGTATSSIGTSSGSLTINSGGGTGGGVNVRPAADTTTAFLVQAASGASMLSVDSVNKAVNIGLSAGTTFGYTGVGSSSSEGSGTNHILAAKFTTSSGGTVRSMSAYGTGAATAPFNQFQFAIYSDSSGSPGTYIASSSVGTLSSVGWFTLPITATLSSATTYWLVYDQNDNVADTNNGLAYNSPQAGGLAVTNSFTFGSGSNNGFPTSFPTAGETVNNNFMTSIYASFTTTNPALVISGNGLMTQNGPAAFQDSSNSPAAFQIQNSTGNPLLTADTSGMTITIGGSLTVTGNITVNGHIITGGGVPTILAGAAACTSPTVNIAGDDTTGTITVTTGTGCSTAGKLTTITYASVFGVAPHVNLTPGTAATAAVQSYVDVPSLSASSFSLYAGITPASSTSYQWEYQVLQ